MWFAITAAVLFHWSDSQGRGHLCARQRHSSGLSLSDLYRTEKQSSHSIYRHRAAVAHCPLFRCELRHASSVTYTQLFPKGLCVLYLFMAKLRKLPQRFFLKHSCPDYNMLFYFSGLFWSSCQVPDIGSPKLSI